MKYVFELSPEDLNEMVNMYLNEYLELPTGADLSLSIDLRTEIVTIKVES